MTPQDLYCTDHHIQAPTVTATWMPGYNARICTLTWYLFTCIYYMFIFIVMLNWLWKMHKKTFKQQKIMELIRMSGMRPKIKILCTQALTYLRNYQNVSELDYNHFCFIVLISWWYYKQLFFRNLTSKCIPI